MSGSDYQPRLHHRIWAAIQESGLTVAEVGERCGVTAACISRWANGRVQPRPDQLMRVAEATGQEWLLDLRGLAPSGLPDRRKLQLVQDVSLDLETTTQEDWDDPPQANTRRYPKFVAVPRRARQHVSNSRPGPGLADSRYRAAGPAPVRPSARPALVPLAVGPRRRWAR